MHAASTEEIEQTPEERWKPYSGAVKECAVIDYTTF